MFWKIVQKEVLLHLREARFVWVVGLFCGLILLGLTLMSQDYTLRLQGYQSSVTAERRELFSVDGSQAVRGQVRGLTNDRGVYAFRPPAALGPLASGLEPAVPTQVHVSDTRSWSRQANETFYRNPLLSLFPKPDFATIIASILSLVALFFTFDAICGEKQSGTLRMISSTVISRDQLLIGKWAGAMLTLGLPFLLATGLGITLLGLLGQVTLDGPMLARTAGVVGFALLYLSLFITLGLAISVLARRPAAALLIALTIWVGTTFVLPHTLASTGAILAPTPTFQQVRMQKRAIDLKRRQEDAQLARQAEGGGLSEEELQRRRTALQEQSEVEKRRIDEDYLRRLDRQVDMSRALSRTSPAACLIYATTELADTGVGFYRRAYEDYGRYRKAFTEYARRLKREADAERLGTDWLRPEEVPLLTFQSQGLEGAFGAVTTELLLLFLFQLAVFGVAYVRFLFYDVR